jgi:hypothetical protein
MKYKVNYLLFDQSKSQVGFWIRVTKEFENLIEAKTFIRRIYNNVVVKDVRIDGATHEELELNGINVRK